ncbi:MAG TPA: acetate uptake transporter [Gaiellaceae bacterium]|nr:acetate uptake transporter [Gaiellaceae bacterium]
MRSLDERGRIAAAGVDTANWEDGFARPRVMLQPIAAPSILGLAGFAGATFIVASNLAGWWGTPTSGLVLAPFAAMFGGLAQFLAGMWAYRARDAVATLAHGTWGAFWLAYGILNILLATHVLTAPTPWYHDPEVGFWFFALAVTTGIAAVAALAENLGVATVLSTLAAGSGILAGGYIFGSHGWVEVAGWVLVFSAGFAWYTVLALVLRSTTGRSVLPTFPIGKAHDQAGSAAVRPIELEWAEPGVKMGQ